MSFVSSRTTSVKINSSLSPPYVNIHGVPQGSVLGPILFIIYILPINSIFHKYPNIHYHLYADDLQIYLSLYILTLFIHHIYTSFPSSSDSDMIQMSIFNYITDLTEWFYHNYLSLNMTKTDTIIFSRPSSPLSITHPCLLSIPTSESITNFSPRLLSTY